MKEAKEVIALFNVKEVVNDVLAEMIHESKSKELNKVAKENPIKPEERGEAFDAVKENAHE